MARRNGFTLIELVMVIVLLGIVSIVSVRFVSLSTLGSLDTSARQLRSLQAVVISEQITRELREAFPLSVRTSGACLEWLPLEAGTNYLNLTSGPGFDEIEIAPFAQIPGVGSTRAVVYGYGTSTPTATELYSGADPGPVSETIDSIDNGASPATITLSGSHQFSATSPARRLFVIGQPVSLCQSGRFLHRYSGYAPASSQPTPPAGTPEILAANLTGTVDFNFQPATLQRAAVVQFTFELANDDATETTTVSQEVQIRNVP